MNFGANTLQRGMTGSEVEELQMCLSGFRGTVWDGDFGPGTELQVITFQRDYMKMSQPTGKVDEETFKALKHFAKEYPIDFEKLKCSCGECEGFGRNQFKDVYRSEKPKVEAYHHYEYPGVHKAILQSYRALQFYVTQAGFNLPFLTCGYRCWINNKQKGRQSTNHMGKALDVDFPLKSGDDKRDDCNRCDAVRSILVEKCGFQVGWAAGNKKALEPSRIAPSWIHMDVRRYAKKYLDNKYFVKNVQDLDCITL